ncbi:hypothetical protein PoMZ_02511 [Pyricularia oryzae]|uniref:Uncharacterized protein n=1 Tax=Pyricularia oryzae TaxID=318829 RepID=A0A4P7N7G7_PYROR|nr:hypothetical protein PoMZ_02511 [Pyricularia oryzae]
MSVLFPVTVFGFRKTRPKKNEKPRNRLVSPGLGFLRNVFGTGSDNAEPGIKEIRKKPLI